MKKMLVVCLVFLVLLTGCNRQMVDTVYSYDKALICMNDGTVIEGEVQSWRDYENSDQIQVKINGDTYLVHSSNVLLIAE